MEETGDSIGYDVQLEKSEDGTTITFTPKELSEERAKQILSQTDIYYLRMLMWLLLDNFSTNPQIIDPWYALCDYLDSSMMAKLGAEPTVLANGQTLACSDTPPLQDQFRMTDPHRRFTYKKISAIVLAQMVETAKLERENRDFSENAKDFAFMMVPVLGPVINAIRHPGEDPLAVSQGVVIDTIGTILTGKLGSAAAGGGKLAVRFAGSKLKNSALALFIKEGAEEAGLSVLEVYGKTVQKLMGRQKFLVKLASALPDVAKVNNSWMRHVMEESIIPLIHAGKAYVLSYEVSKPVFNKLLGAIEKWDGGSFIYRLGILPREQILETIENNWVIVVKDKDFMKQWGIGTRGFAQGRMVVLKESAVSEDLLAHEFTHVISSNLLPKYTAETAFRYSQDQANIYGAVMSQIYEMATDMTTKDLLGLSGTYKTVYPRVYAAMERLLVKFQETTNMHLSGSDYIEFALTGSDQTLIKRLAGGMDSEKFLSIVKEQMNAVTLMERLKAQAQYYLGENLRESLTVVGVAGSTGFAAPFAVSKGVYLMQDYFAAKAQGEEIPSDAVIIPVTPEGDIDISLPSQE